MSRKDQTKGQTTESLEQFRVYDDFKSDDYERKLKVCEVCSCNSHSQNKLCVVFRLSFSLKRLRFLTPAWLRENIHSNIYSECTEKWGVNYMLDNLRKVDILQLSNFLDQKVKISSKRYICSLSRLKGAGSMRSDKSLFSFSLQINNKFSGELAVQVSKQIYKK